MLFENLIIGLFCCAVGARLIQHIRRKTCADGCERFTLFTIGVSSVIGIIGKCYSENQWSAMLYCIGAYLTIMRLTTLRCILWKTTRDCLRSYKWKNKHSKGGYLHAVSENWYSPYH